MRKLSNRTIGASRLTISLASLCLIAVGCTQVESNTNRGDTNQQSTTADKNEDNTNIGENTALVRADGLPRPGFEVIRGQTAIVITDPQNDFLSPKGAAWGVVGKSVIENDVIANLETLFETAENIGMPVFISPHYYFPHDHQWKFEGALEQLMHSTNMFDRKSVLQSSDVEGSGADWLDRYKPYINNGKTVVTSPHKIYGPETNDLALQLRKAGISKVILAGMSANLCTESHLRELVEQGFEVQVVSDATAGAITSNYDGYQSAMTNFRFIASDVDTTANIAAAMRNAFN